MPPKVYGHFCGISFTVEQVKVSASPPKITHQLPQQFGSVQSCSALRDVVQGTFLGVSERHVGFLFAHRHPYPIGCPLGACSTMSQTDGGGAKGRWFGAAALHTRLASKRAVALTPPRQGPLKAPCRPNLTTQRAQGGLAPIGLLQAQ